MSTQDETLQSVNEMKQMLQSLVSNLAAERELTQRRLERIESEVAKIAGGLAVVLAHDKAHQTTLDDHKKKFILFPSI